MSVFTETDAQAIAWEQFGIQGEAKQLAGESDLNFRIDSISESFVLKASHPSSEVKSLELQNRAMALCEPFKEFISPTVLKSRDRQFIVPKQIESGAVWYIRCLSYVGGTPLGEIPADDVRRNEDLWRAIGRCAARLDNALAPLSRLAKGRQLQWDLAMAPSIVRESEILKEKSERSEILNICLANYENIQPRLELLPSSVIHNDLNDYNIMIPDPVDDGSSRRIGVIDFGDVVYSKTIHNLAICLAYVMLDMPDPIEVATLVVSGYNQVRELSESEVSVLFPLACMRLAQSVSISHEQTKADPTNEYLAISQKPAWDLLNRIANREVQEICEQFSAECRSRKTGSAVSALATDNSTAVNDLAERRKQSLSPSLSLSYQKPLHIVRGNGQYLYDQNDATYLDCVNNVCHVGHCHPDVVTAARQQIGVLNTNTRYLHENIVRLAEQLTATLPPPLEVCFFVNSGSEANDLALRMARNFTGQHDMCVIDHAYHGHVSSLIEISPYKFDSPGGKGKPVHTHVLPTPDTYRGTIKATVQSQASHEACAAEYAKLANDVVDAAIKSRGGIAGLIAEPILSCGGQVPLPPGYLPEVYKNVRSHGGICISDEVQVGFGRVGSHFWGFQQHDVSPDIVTMGKPFGNGHPLAAVVTTRAIADAFNNGMEYFNTFGGNPVSCAIGLAVMNVIEKEKLQHHAKTTGDWLLEQFGELKKRHEIIGDVRGSGFFLGIEFVNNRETLEPASDVAKQVVNQMRAKSILLSTDGPLENVIKFKPPMVFSEADAERVVWTLEKVLTNVCG